MKELKLKEKSKKLRKSIATAAMTAFMILGCAGSAFAAETEDHSFYFSVKGQYTYTAERPKTNTTSVYVKVNYNSNTAYIQTYGYAKNDQGNYAWLNLTQFVTTVTASPSQASSIHTLIYERGGRRAKLRGRAVSNNFTSSGVWSPDSTRNYTFLN